MWGKKRNTIRMAAMLQQWIWVFSHCDSIQPSTSCLKDRMFRVIACMKEITLFLFFGWAILACRFVVSFKSRHSNCAEATSCLFRDSSWLSNCLSSITYLSSPHLENAYAVCKHLMLARCIGPPLHCFHHMNCSFTSTWPVCCSVSSCINKVAICT